MVLALCLAGTGCRSTPLGQALFGGGGDDSTSSSPRFVLFARRNPPPAVNSSFPIGETSEQIAWRPATQPSDPPAPAAKTAPAPPVALAQPPADKQVVPIDWRSQDPALDFPAGAPEPDKGAKATENLPAPRPLPAPEIHMDVGMPPPGMPLAFVSGGPHAPVPHELNMMSLPPYTVEPPDILLVESARGLPTQPVRGQHLVRPDGTINLGIYGSIYVTGMTLDQIKAAIAPAIASRLDKEALAKNPVKPEDVSVDVLAYNSKVYYVITDGGGYGEQVYRVPVTGNERVLDAIAQINGLPAVSSKKHIWVARRVPGHGAHDQVLPVDWCGITQRGEAATNYQIFPGDRVYVKAQHLILIDSTIAKILSPIERLLGVTLLGSETVNSIRNRGTSTSP